MNSLKTFVRSILLVEIAAIAGLLAAGVILTWVEPEAYDYYGNFFTYRLRYFYGLPAWFIGSLLLMVINGVWMFRLASIEGMFQTPRGDGWPGRASLPINPLRLFAVNLIAIPAILVLFLIVRANGW